MQTKTNGGRRRVRAAFVLTAAAAAAAGSAPSSATAAGVAARWLQPVGGDWTTASAWSSAPAYPDNSAAASYDVTIDAVSALYPYTITVGQGADPDVTVDSLTMGYYGASVSIVGGTFRAGSRVSVEKGVLELVGATLQTPRLETGGGYFSFASGAVVGARISGIGREARVSSAQPGPLSRTFRGGTTLAGDVVFFGDSSSDGRFSVVEGLTFEPGANLFLRGATLSLGTAPVSGGGTIVLDGDYKWPDSRLLPGSALPATLTVKAREGTPTAVGGVGTIGSPDASFDNYATIEASGIRGSVTVHNATNYGQLRAADGGTLVLSGGRNRGTITLDYDGRLTLTGTIATADLGTIRRPGDRTIVRLSGVLDNAGQTFDTTAVGGWWRLEGGVVRGGRISSSDGSYFSMFDDPGNTFDNVTLAADLIMDPGSYLKLVGTTTLEQTAVLLRPANRPTAFLELAGTLAGTGQLVFTGTGTETVSVRIGAESAIGSGVTVRTESASGILGPAAGAPAFPLTNAGTILADAAGRSMTIVASSFANTGTLRAAGGSQFHVSAAGGFSNSGTVAVADGSALTIAAPLTNTGMISVGNGSTLTLGPIIANTGSVSVSYSSLVLNSSTSTAVIDGFALDGAVVRANAITLTNTGRTFAPDADAATWELSGTTIVGGVVDLLVPPALKVVGSTTLQDVTLRGALALGTGTTLTTSGLSNEGTITADTGSKVVLGGNWSNTGSIAVTRGTLTLARIPATAGTIALTDGTLQVTGPIATGDLRRISVSKSQLLLEQGGVLDNGGGTVSIADFPRGIWVNGGTVAGGRIGPAAPGSSASFVTSGNATLEGITLATRLNVSGGLTTVKGGLRLDGGSVRVTGGGSVAFPGTDRIDGNGTVELDSFSTLYASTGTLTVGPGVTVVTGNGSAEIGRSTAGLVVEGKLAATAGRTLSVRGSTISASGAASAAAGATVRFYAPLFVAGATLAGDGTFVAEQDVVVSGNVTRTGAGVTRVLHSLVLLPQARLDLGTSDLILDYATTSPMAAGRTALTAGRNSGRWDGAGITSSVATGGAGTALALAEKAWLPAGTFHGQAVDATTVVIKYTWLGDANFDGIVNNADRASFVAGLSLAAGTARWTDGDFDYSGTVDADDYMLLSIGLSASGGRAIGAVVPEPGGLGAGLAALSVGAGRRRRKMS